MTLVLIYSLIILGFLWGTQIFKRPLLVKIAKPLFYVAIIGIGILIFYHSRAQFLAWYNAPPPAKYLVPPYQGIGYFLFYITSRFWSKYLISFGISVLIFLASSYFNEKFNRKFFHKEEPFIIALSVFLVGHPLWLIYLILVLALYLIYTLFSFKKGRISFYYFWLPVAILIIALTPYLKTLKLFSALNL